MSGFVVTSVRASSCFHSRIEWARPSLSRHARNLRHELHGSRVWRALGERKMNPLAARWNKSWQLR
eukprot:8732403-Pyramimonas_sp.AAC.1